jgi:hypothetical protein
MTEPPVPPPCAARLCLNCGAVLSGRYCANCSQPADVHVPSTRELLHEALEGLTHSDSRLWRTLHLLWFRPGKLSQEFVAGRRASYLPPFRLYLVLSILFFLSASLVNPHPRIVRFDGTVATSGVSEPECAKVNATEFHVTLFGRDWAPRIKLACYQIARDNGASLLHAALGTAPKAMFIFLPLVALLHMLMYWWPRHRYAVHLLFFVHLHAFFFSVMTLAVLAAAAARAWPALAPVLSLVPLLLWTLPPYTVVAMRRVFGRSWGLTLLKASALFAVYMVVLVMTLAGIFVYAVLQM